MSALTAVASFAGPPSALSHPPGGDPDLSLGLGRVRTDKNCYLPGQTVTITLKNVGSAPLIYSSIPDFEVENDTIGTVRMVRDWQMGGFHLDPGATMTWTWDQKWRAWDSRGSELHKGQYVPRGDYTVLAEALVGVEMPDKVEIAHARFAIGDCLAQISAGDDVVASEGQTFQFNPRIQITGDATITSVTWDLDPKVDSNGDGNFTNDIDLAGWNPTASFGDNGVYPVTMNVRGFGSISGMDRVAQDAVFVIDSSDSMSWRDPLDYRKVSVKDYVDWMVRDDRGAVVDMDSFGHLVHGDHLGMDYAQIKANVDTIDSTGGLYLASGLFVSLYELRDFGDKAHKWIVIFATGAETENPRDPFYIPRAITLAKDLGVTVYTVGLSIVEPDSVQMMKKIAADTGGKYFSAALGSNLRKIYEDIAAEKNTSQGFYFTVTDSLSVTVGNLPPVLSIDPAAPRNVTSQAVLAVNVTDPGTDDVTLRWDWGDGGRDTRTVFNDGVGPDPYPSPWGLPAAFVDVGRHVYRLPGDYRVTLTATDDDGGTSQTNTTVHVSSSADLKREAILHIKALKERALERGDGRFLHELDEAERHVWKSLGYVNPFEPESVAPAPASNVSVGTGADDGVEVRLDSSWNSKLASYTSIRLAWSNGVVTIVSLPAGLRDKEREFRVTPWVDSWHQDVRIETERKRGGGMTLEVEVREASMGFALSFDSDAVATFSFTYETRRLWTDATHLDPTFGHKVFDEERKAVNDLLCGGDERDDQEHDDSSGAIRDAGADTHDRERGGDDDHEHEGCGEEEHGDHGGEHEHDDGGTAAVGCPADSRKWNDSERAALDAECDLVANLLVKADEFLALVVIQDAKDTSVQNPKHSREVALEIAKAERDLVNAYHEWDEHEYGDAIQAFQQAWKHAQHAIRDANKK